MHEDAWTTRRLLEWISTHLDTKGVHNPPVVARMLLTHVLGGTDIDLYTDPDRPASPAERDTLRGLVTRAASHEPVQYIVGKADFFGRSFRVDRSTLIPRTATESLVQVVLDWYRGTAAGEEPRESLRLADLGTGTGCIAITLVRQIPTAHAVATDVSEAALALCRANAEAHGVSDRLAFALGSGLEPLRDQPPLDVICGNLPYVPDTTWATLDANVREHEPESALRGGPDGLDVIRPVIAGIGPRLAAGGLLVLEIDPLQSEAVLEAARAVSSLATAEVVRDEFGDNRVLRATSAVSLPVQ